MYKIPVANENKRRPQAAIGSERAARLAALKNLDARQPTAPQVHLAPSLAVVDCWSTIESERVAHLEALRNLYPRKNSAEKKITQGPEGTIYKALAANDNKTAPQAAIGSERAARLALIENLDPGSRHNLNLHLPNADFWPSSMEEKTPAPPRALEAIGSERVARLAALQLQSPLHGDNDDMSSWESPNTYCSGTSLVPGWQQDPLSEVHPRSGNIFLTFPPEEAAAQLLAKQQMLESTLQSERVPHPDTNPLPTPPPTLTSGAEELCLLLDSTRVQAESSWLRMLPESKGKAESSPLPKLQLALRDEGALDDLQYVQAKNYRLAERILTQMPNEQSRQRFQHDLLRRQLRSEQQLTSFLEGKLDQVATAPGSESLWMSWLGNGEDTVAAGGDRGDLASARM
ncbi:hypothetical protein KR038_004609 [Drosophila bunnanda]|nr:hypothetical protein KR038_004609 [Drosophila bunnanda]